MAFTQKTQLDLFKSTPRSKTNDWGFEIIGQMSANVAIFGSVPPIMLKLRSGFRNIQPLTPPRQFHNSDNFPTRSIRCHRFWTCDADHSYSQHSTRLSTTCCCCPTSGRHGLTEWISVVSGWDGSDGDHWFRLGAHSFLSPSIPPLLFANHFTQVIVALGSQAHQYVTMLMTSCCLFFLLIFANP